MMTHHGCSAHRIYFMVAIVLLLCFWSAQKSEGRSAVDQMGRTVTIPDNPVRIVSMAPSITEIIFFLGEGGRLKGVTQHCDFPAEAQALPKVGSYVHLDLERIVALRPDLCIATRDGNPRTVVDKLEKLGIPVYAVDPRSLDTAVGTVLELGQLLGATVKAEALANSMRAKIASVKANAETAVRRPRVFFQIETAPIVSVGENTIIHELITAAGGENLAAGPVTYPRFSREQILALAPQIIIITSMSQEEDSEKMEGEWKQYDSLPAVQNDAVFVVNSNLFDRPTPRLIEGLETLAAIIHPEIFR